MSKLCHIQMFSGLRVQQGERVITRFRTQQTGALFAYLAFHSHRSHSREVLIDIFWPESEPEAGRHSLRQALSSLRKVLEPSGISAGDFINSDRFSIQLNPDAILTDVDKFESALDSASEANDDAKRSQFLKQAIDVYHGELLSGFYEDWILPEQRRLADLYFQAVRDLSTHSEIFENWGVALNYARRAIALDPLREDAHQDLMRLLTASGQPFAALRQFRELEKVLTEELDAKPADSSLELAHEIERRVVGSLQSNSDKPPSVLTLLVVDICDSDELPKNATALPAIPPDDPVRTILRDTLGDFTEAEIISTETGSFVLGFAKPSDSVRYALTVQSRLRRLPKKVQSDVHANIGIHLGEVIDGEKDKENGDLSALSVHIATASCLAAISSGGQILMTRGVFDNARQICHGAMLSGVGEIRWLNHGPYLLKGFEESLDICEVGEVGTAPLQAPTDSELAKSVAAPGTEMVLGWRPSVEQNIPNTEWILKEKLGEGGFGEVWRAKHEQTMDSRVFKFCFHADKLRHLKREMTLFRLLKETLGDRKDIARLFNVQFDEAPYYLELEDAPGGSLPEWFRSQGGFENVSLDARLDIAAQTAAALAAAHSVGVLHKDIKPSNILIKDRDDGSPQVRLTDFGIGQLMDRDILANAGVTAAGFTETLSTRTTMSSYTGTRLYMAPELLAGRPPSIQSDIYSLGVMLYQLIAGNLSKPLTTDWERDITDPLLRRDLHRCLAGDPEERFSGGTDVARRIRDLPLRRAKRRLKRIVQVSVGAICLLIFIVGAWSFLQADRRKQAEDSLARETALRLAAEASEERSNTNEKRAKASETRVQKELYYSSIQLAEKLIGEHNYTAARETLKSCRKELRNWEWGRLQYLCNLDLLTIADHKSEKLGVFDLNFSPDGNRLITLGDDGVRIWDFKTGRESAFFPDIKWIGVVFSPDGRSFATGQGIYDVQDGRLLSDFLKAGIYGEKPSFSPDGQRLAVKNFIWDIEAEKVVIKLEGHKDVILVTQYSPDGKYVATVSLDKTTKIWDAKTGKELTTLRGHTDRVWSVEFDPESRRVATSSWDGTVRIWDVETGEESNPIVGTSFNDASFSPDGARIVTAGSDHVANIWDAETGKLLLSLRGHTGPLRQAVFSPSGRFVVTGSRDGTAKIWDATTSHEERVFEGHEGFIQAIDISPDGASLATYGADKTIRIWNTETGTESFRTVGQMDETLIFDQRGSRLLATSTDGFVRIRDAVSGTELLRREQGVPLLAAAFSPDNQLVATGDSLGKVEVWHSDTGKNVRKFTAHDHVITSIAFSPDGQRILTTAMDRVVRLWDVRTGQEILSYLGQGDNILYSNFSPDGGRVITAGTTKTVSVWDTYTGKELLTLSGIETDSVHTAFFSPDGCRILTSGSNGFDHLWDAETGRLCASFGKSDRSLVRCSAMSGSGLSIVTGGFEDGTAILWEAFPWNNKDLPGKSGDSYDKRLREWKRDKWEKRRVADASVVRITSRAADAVETERRRLLQLDVCAKNLNAIQEALQLYRKNHAGSNPDWLSNLVPDYLTSAALLCPCDPEGNPVVRQRDPGLPCSYWYAYASYEPWIGAGPLRAREPKLRSLTEYNNKYVALCRHHVMKPYGNGSLSLSKDGELYQEVRTGQFDKYVPSPVGKLPADLTSTRATSDTCAVERVLGDDAYSPGIPLEVELRLDWRGDAKWLRVSENTPNGWEIKDVSHDGKVNGNKTTWLVDPWTSSGLTLTYTVIPPIEKCHVPVAFAYSFARAQMGSPLRIPDTVIAPSGVLAFQDGALPEPSYQGCQDSHIMKHAYGASANRCTHIEEGGARRKAGDPKKILLQFDLSKVPSAFALDHAELRLYAYGIRYNREHTDRVMHTLYATPVQKTWSEGQGKAHTEADGLPAQEGDLTYNDAQYKMNAWEKPGALGLSDLGEWESVATVGDTWPGWVSFDVTESVRDFLTTPTLNNGWKISEDNFRGKDDWIVDYVTGIYTYKSSESPEVSLRPMLILVPEENPKTECADQYLLAGSKPLLLDDCALNLMAIHGALAAFREERAGESIENLTDLVPDYLSSATLICPGEKTKFAIAKARSPFYCSYQYHAPEKSRNRDSSNMTPVARCQHHGEQLLNLSQSGSIYLSPEAWETGPIEDYRAPETRILPAATPNSPEEFLTLLREFQLTQGRYGRWEKLPDLARLLVKHSAADANRLHALAWEIVDSNRRAPEAALTLAREAVRLEPDNFIFLDTLAWAELLMGRNTQSADRFKRAAEGMVELKGVPLAGQAIALARLGQIDLAWRTLYRASGTKNNPDCFFEAYVEVAKAGLPSNPKLHELTRKYWGKLAASPDALPDFELPTTSPRADEEFTVRFRPWRKIPNPKQMKFYVKWGVNHWQYPGDDAAKAEGTTRLLMHGSYRPTAIRQAMKREGDVWTATLRLPRWTRQVNLTFAEEDAYGSWRKRCREVHIPILPPLPKKRF